MAALPIDVVGFWREARPKKWFAANPAFDEAIRLKFEPVHHRAARGEYDGWAGEAQGALALLILLDQFPRNLYRGSAHAFATDPKAQAIALRAVEARLDAQVEPDLRTFFYMPFQHSEELAHQELSVKLFAALGDSEYLHYAHLHHEIIAQFGRFPHRNPMLGRTTTPEEQAFLDEGGFAG